jgi:TPR repeat protein
MTNLDESMESGEESAASKAFKRYLRFAEKNDVASQLKIADMFSIGEGVEKNEESAIVWYKKAASQENVEAMQKLAQILERNKNYEAKYWWIKLAETGDTLGEYKTALLYLNSSHVKKHAQGVSLLRQAAEKKFTKAEYFLGYLLVKGIKTKKDANIGCLFLKQAAEKNFVPAQRRLGIELFERDEKDCSGKEAFYWLSEGAKNEDGLCFYYLGHCFLNGKGTYKSEKDAFYCFERAAGKNIAEAQHSLACCYANGSGTQKDEKKFLELLLTASTNGDLSAKYKLAEIILHEIYQVPSHLSKEYANKLLEELTQKKHIKGTLLYARYCGDDALSFKLYQRMATSNVVEAFGNLAYAYENGLGVKKSEKKGSIWRKKDCECGDAEKQFSYANRLYYGFGAKKNKREAFKWYYEAGKKNFSKAYSILGQCFHFGEGTKRNPEKAITWYEKAAENGETDVYHKLGLLYLAEYKNKELKARKNDPLLKSKSQFQKKAVHWLMRSAEQGDVDAQNHVAWILATSNDCVIRNGVEAEKWVKKAIRTKDLANAYWMDTLAAAYAEQGKFDDAVTTQKKVISMLKMENVRKRKEFYDRLKSYQEKRPWRDSAEISLA